MRLPTGCDRLKSHETASCLPDVRADGLSVIGRMSTANGDGKAAQSPPNSALQSLPVVARARLPVASIATARAPSRERAAERLRLAE